MWTQGILINSKLLLLLKIRTLFLCFVIFLFSICVGGIWNCTDHDCPGICISFLFSHFRTKIINFSDDNRTIYDPRLLAANLETKTKQVDIDSSCGPAGMKLLFAWSYCLSHLFPLPQGATSTSCLLSLAYAPCICHRWCIFTACGVPRPGIRITSLIGETLL